MKSINEFINELNRYNLATWYVLPLTKLNVESFCISNFINCYLSTKEMILLVEVADLNMCRQNLGLVGSEHFLGEHTKESREFMVFRIPALFEPDVELFRAGQYSQFSDIAKFTIRAYSGLKNNWKDDKGNLITDAILLALEKHPILRRKWEEELGLSSHILTEDCELLSIPSGKNFKNFENLYPIPPEINDASGDKLRNAQLNEALELAAKFHPSIDNFSNNRLNFRQTL